MKVIIAKDGHNITYDNVSSVKDYDDRYVLTSTGDVEITLNGWLIARASTCVIEKRCLICVDNVFLDGVVYGG